jgi:hypothetical protein
VARAVHPRTCAECGAACISQFIRRQCFCSGACRQKWHSRKYMQERKLMKELTAVYGKDPGPNASHRAQKFREKAAAHYSIHAAAEQPLFVPYALCPVCFPPAN